jgi:hypothetical protein
MHNASATVVVGELLSSLTKLWINQARRADSVNIVGHRLRALHFFENTEEQEEDVESNDDGSVDMTLTYCMVDGLLRVRQSSTSSLSKFWIIKRQEASQTFKLLFCIFIESIGISLSDLFSESSQRARDGSSETVSSIIAKTGA